MPYIASRPALAIDGQITTGLSKDLISAAYDDGIDRLTVTLSNLALGANGLEYPYSEGNLIQLGKRLELYLDCGSGNLKKIFEGKIAALAPSFTSDKPSTILVEANGFSEKTGTTVTATFGRELLDFRPAISSGKASIDCSGTVEGNPELRRGSTLYIRGTGRAYEGLYSVIKTIHSFDLRVGYRTHFVATTGKRENFRRAK